MVFGSVVAGLSVLTHTHTPPQLTSLMEEICPTQRVAKHPPTAISRPPGSCSPSCTSHLVTNFFHAQEFSWVLPMKFSPANLRPLHCCAFSHRGIPSCFGLHAQDFAGFTHAAVFLCGLVNSVAVSCTHGTILGSALLLTLTHRLGDCNFFPNSVCICFLGDFVAQDGLCFSTLLVVLVVVFITCWGLL